MSGCDECMACCKTLEVHELRKPNGVECVHCSNGCMRYETRPQSCRTFVCAWLGSQATARPLPAEFRPDRSGVILGELDTGEPAAFIEDALAPRDGPIWQFLRTLTRPVVIMVGNDREGLCE